MKVKNLKKLKSATLVVKKFDMGQKKMAAATVTGNSPYVLIVPSFMGFTSMIQDKKGKNEIHPFSFIVYYRSPNLNIQFNYQ